MFGFKKLLSVPAKDEALPGRAAPIPTARQHFINGNPLKGPYPAGLETAMFGMGCFWGAERKFWELGDGVFTTAVGYAAGHTPNPTYEEVCSRPHRPQRGGAGGLRSEEDFLREAAEDVLGEPRPDPGHAPGQRRRHAVSLRHLRDDAGAEARRRGSRKAMYARRWRRGYGAITTEILDAPPFYFAEDYHQQYLAKNPMGYCGLGGTGVSCPVGVGAGRRALDASQRRLERAAVAALFLIRALLTIRGVNRA